MANKFYLKEKTIPIFKQMISLKTSYPNGKCEVNGNSLFWTGKISPSPLSREYSTIIYYELYQRPDVFIYGDELQNLDSPNFPHKYSVDLKGKMVKICLYRYQEFSSKKFLSKTIIPWTVEWLYFYEIWLLTGEWYGGGDHPNIGESKENDSKIHERNAT